MRSASDTNCEYFLACAEPGQCKCKPRCLSRQLQGEAATLGRRSEDGMEDVSVDTVMEAEDSQGPGVGDTDTDEMDTRQDEVSGALCSQAWSHASMFQVEVQKTSIQNSTANTKSILEAFNFELMNKETQFRSRGKILKYLKTVDNNFQNNISKK